MSFLAMTEKIRGEDAAMKVIRDEIDFTRRRLEKLASDLQAEAWGRADIERITAMETMMAMWTEFQLSLKLKSERELAKFEIKRAQEKERQCLEHMRRLERLEKLLSDKQSL